MGIDGVNNTAPTWQTTGINDISTTNKTNEKSCILNKVLNKLAEGRDFILNKLGNKTNALITIGQVGGAAAMTAGAAALLFTGVAASLTVGGIPLGIPLIAGGAVLFTAGSGLLIAKISANVKSTLGEKIKEFFSVTCKNALVGIGIGSLGALFSQEGVRSLAASAVAGVESADKAVDKIKDEISKIGKKADGIMQDVNNFNQAIGNFQDESIPKKDENNQLTGSNDVKK